MSRIPLPVIPVAVETASAEEVYNVITAAASQDPRNLKASADRLKQLFNVLGTYDALSKITVQRTVPLQVRQQSIIQLKNGVVDHWRSRKLLPPDHKANIRDRALSLLAEPDPLIAECNEILIAKIARQDYPAQWPNLATDLLNTINMNFNGRYHNGPSDFLSLRRALEVLNAVIKELASAKILTGMKHFEELVREMHPILEGHYNTVFGSLMRLNPGGMSSPHNAEEILLSHLVFKCVVKCAHWTWQRKKKDDQTSTADFWPQALFENCARQLQYLFDLRLNIVIGLIAENGLTNPIAQQTVKDLTRHVMLYGRLFRRFQQLDARRFANLPLCGDLVLFYWSKVVQSTTGPAEYIGDSPYAVCPVRLLVQGMMLFKESLLQWAPMRKDGKENSQVLSKDFVEEAVRILVTRFIPLNPADLETWENDPEEWVNVEEREGDQWEYELRPCGERVLMTLANHYRAFVEPMLEATFKSMRPQKAADLSGLLQKEALYCALGRCANRMKDLIPFEEWLNNELSSEAQETNQMYAILKRRIAWLIGQWISSECSGANNPMVWQILVYLLQNRGPGTDAVVRLTAVVALRQCVDTISFDLNVFAPFLPAIVSELLQMISEAESVETKRRILNTLNTVIERSETRIVPFLAGIAGPLPQLWIAAGDDWLYKLALLDTLSKLISSSKEESAPLTPLVVTLVGESLVPPAKQNLDVDGLSLLQTALRNAPNNGVAADTNPGLAVLFPNIVSLLGDNLDLLATIVGILESYIVLNATFVAERFASDIFQNALRAMRDGNDVAVKPIVIAIELLIQLAPPQLWGEALHVSGLFAYITEVLLDEKRNSLLLTQCVLLFARIAASDGQLFVRLVSFAAPMLKKTEAELYDGLLTQWWTRFDNMHEPRHRKLAAMGIASLVASGRDEILERLPTEICNLWLDVFGELKEAQTKATMDGSPEALTLYWDHSAEYLWEDAKDTPEFARRQSIYDADPVRSVQLTAYISNCIQSAQNAVGGAAILQSKYMGKADPKVIEQIQAGLAGKY